jgi:hypothetical protein
MSGTVRAEQARFCQSPGITPVDLHLAGPRRIHRREVRVGDNHLVAKRLETADHPFAIGRGLDQHPGMEPGSQHGGEALGLGADALFENRAPSAEMKIWLSLSCTSMQIWSMAGLSDFFRRCRGVLLSGLPMPPRQARRPAASSRLRSQLMARSYRERRVAARGVLLSSSAAGPGWE